jgi:signal transduction histidine kinase
MKTALLSILLCLSGAAICLGFQNDTTGFSTQRFTDENGMPQNSVTGLACDNIGFVWIATQGGLVRFDGQKMLTYNKSRLSVSSDRFVALKVDVLTGCLYAVNEHNQLVVIKNGAAARSKRYKTELELDLVAITPSTDTVSTKYGFRKYRIIAGKQGRYYVYTNRTVSFYEAGKLKATLPFPGEPCFDPMPGELNMRKKFVQKHKKLICSENFMSIGQSLFYHTGGEGLSLLKVSAGGTVPLLLKGDIERNPRFATGKEGIRIISNRFKGQAFAYLAGHFYLVNYSEGNDFVDTKLLIDDFDMEDNLVSRMLYDEGNRALFLGSFSKGLWMIRPNLFHVVANRLQKDFHNVFYAHLPYSKSSVIVPDGFILGDFKASPRDGAAFRSGETTQRMSMLKDKTGDFWIIKQNKVFHLGPDAARQKSVWEFNEDAGLIYQDLAGQIWVGFESGKAAVLKPGATSADAPRQILKLSGACRFLHQDKPGRMWIGASNGLYLYDTQKQAVYPVKGMAQKHVRSIYSTKVGELWITTYGDGIFLLADNRLIKMPLDKNGYLSHAHCILEDSQNNFWISSNKGLFRASKADLLAHAKGNTNPVFYRLFGREDGFMTNEFNGGCQPCAVRLDDGHYSFPSMSGLVWFKPGQIPYPDLSAALLLENLIVDEQAQPMKDTLRLSYNFRHVVFDLASPYTGLSDNLDFHYALLHNTAGHKRWIRVDKDQKINIYALTPGSYTMIIRKTSGFGNKFVEKKLVLIVNSPWFLSWWFIALLLCGLALLFWLLTKWRLANLRRQNALLSKKVEERTENLSRALDHLKASDQALQTQLQIQMRIIGVINHDVHSPLRYLNKHIPDFLEQIAPYLPTQETVRLGSAIGKSTQKVYGLVDDLLKFIKSTYNKKGQIVYEPVAVRQILEKKAQFFSEIASEYQTVITIKPGPSLSIDTNRIMVEIMIHNLLDNAVKHTFERSVTLSAWKSADKKLSIAVADTGSGMAPEIINWLNGKGSRVHKPAKAEIPMDLGLGLVMVKEIAQLLGVQIIANSSLAGTEIELLFSE